MGGHETKDGRTMRRGQVYRSGMMVHLTEADHVLLEGLGVRVICDLRTTREQRRDPTRWQNIRGADYWSRDYESSHGDIGRLMERGTFSAEEAREAMLGNYREMPFEQAESYREMFRRLAQGHVPLVFNCSVGKDRTGIAAALLYKLLDIPLDIILHEYTLTNEFLARDSDRLAERGVFKKWPTHDYFMPLIRAEPDYLMTMFKTVDERCGSLDRYFQDLLGVDSRRADDIRAHLLE
jgi:protein-tyrosine phosphatase